MRWLALTALAGFALSGAASATARPDEKGTACVAARVHYEKPPTRLGIRLPWVSAGRPGRRIVGYLFYYGEELRKGTRLTIYTGGELPQGGATKILWVPRPVGSSQVTVSGRRLDGPGTFRDEFRSASSASGIVFPSIVNVPEAGCWLLTIRNGRAVGRFAVEAISATSSST
jgi:hypothetical protein